jgi:hypothetical protein
MHLAEYRTDCRPIKIRGSRVKTQDGDRWIKYLDLDVDSSAFSKVRQRMASKNMIRETTLGGCRIQFFSAVNAVDEAEKMFEEYAQQLQSQGIPVDMYLQYQGLDADKFKETLIPQADQRIRTRLVLEAVVDAEKIEISEEEFDAEISRLAEQYKMEKDQLTKIIGDFEKKQMEKDLAVQKAITLLVENATEA